MFCCLYICCLLASHIILLICDSSRFRISRFVVESTVCIIQIVSSSLIFTIVQTSILYVHLIKARKIPRSRLRIQRQIRHLHTTSLQRSALHTPIRDIPLQSVVSSNNGKVCETDFEGIAGCYCRTACQTINTRPYSCKVPRQRRT
jgi:hypothetical protein